MRAERDGGARARDSSGRVPRGGSWSFNAWSPAFRSGSASGRLHVLAISGFVVPGVYSIFVFCFMGTGRNPISARGKSFRIGDYLDATNSAARAI